MKGSHPMTITANAELDEPALHRLIDSLLAGGVEGIFVLGTTGEGAHVPRELRHPPKDCAIMPLVAQF